MRTGLIPLRALGILSQSFSSPSIINPPTKPAKSAPRKPEGTSPPILTKVEPVVAR